MNDQVRDMHKFSSSVKHPPMCIELSRSSINWYLVGFRHNKGI